MHLKDRIPAGVLPLVNGNETAGGKEQQEETKHTSAFHLRREKFDNLKLTWVITDQYWADPITSLKSHLTSTWQPHSPSTNSPIFHWKFQTKFSPLHIHPLTQNFTFGLKWVGNQYWSAGAQWRQERQPKSAERPPHWRLGFAKCAKCAKCANVANDTNIGNVANIANAANILPR